jgi:hypothetical protein
MNITNRTLELAYNQLTERPYVAIPLALATVAYACYKLFSSEQNPDLGTCLKIGREIQEMNITIADAADYDFTPAHRGYVSEDRAKKASLGYMAAFAQSFKKQGLYGDDLSSIIVLGESVARTGSGQCDHMAALVIAKIVEHIRNGGTWNSPIELAGNGAHAFVLINRKGALNDPYSWGKTAILFDSWLAKIGVKADRQDSLTTGESGVISRPSDVQRNAASFGAERFHVRRQISVQELYQAAGR